MFLRHGYDATTTQMILSAAGLSKGALYHHFSAKDDIAEAIYSETSKMAIEYATRAISSGAPPLERLKQATFAWLDHIRDPDIACIMLEIGPEALGWRRAKAIEDDHSLAAMTAILQAAEQAGEIEISSAPVVARLLNAVLAEAALIDIEFQGGAHRDVKHALERIIDGFRPPGLKS